MTRRFLAYAFPFMDSLDPIAPATDGSAIDDALQMDEEAFRGFYTRTSAMLWAYLARATNDPAAADDLLQEAYYRLLRTATMFESDEHRKNYLFRIATNLIRDRFRRRRFDTAQLPENGDGDIPASGDLARQTQQRSDRGGRWRG
jgi:RNA polymerase sigma-70 factor (ECF subfamily)